MLAPSYSSSIIFLGSQSDSLASLGVEFAADTADVQVALKQHPFKALLVEVSQFSDDAQIETFLKESRALNPKAQIVFIGDQRFSKLGLSLFNRGLVQFFTTEDEVHIESTITAAIAAFDRQEQDDSFFQLFDEQNERLSTLKTKLQERVDKRQKFLNSARAKLSRTDKNVRLLQKCFIAVHRSQSFEEIEERLLSILSLDQGIQEIKISIQQNRIEPAPVSEKETQRSLAYALVAEDREFGTAEFFRDIRQPFSDLEEDLLSQISDAISLASTRLLVLEELEQLTRQWETTFNALSDPLCLMDDSLKILKGNEAMARVTQLKHSELTGKNPFELLNIDRKHLASVASKDYRARIETEVFGESFVFDVIEQNLSQTTQAPVRIVIFRDITQTALLEKQALESSKLAELGIIGSSIAHELNNPLGGILNFLQLIKMDLKENDPNKADFDEMETAAVRCKQIVESLLGFARKEDSTNASEFRLNEALDQAIKICEIQTKSRGIQVDWKADEFDFEVNGHKNQWIQVLRNILQNSIDAIDRKSQQTPEFQGSIRIRLGKKQGATQIQIEDNGDGIAETDMPKIFNPLFSRKEGESASGLGLTIAFRILNEHQANLFFKSLPTSGTTAIISLKSPEIKGSSQVFDTKI